MVVIVMPIPAAPLALTSEKFPIIIVFYTRRVCNGTRYIPTWPRPSAIVKSEGKLRMIILWPTVRSDDDGTKR